MRLNCWEFKACGREPGGPKVVRRGVCPAATDIESNGMHGGINAGRICWSVTGTFCGGEVQGTFAQKQASCVTCDFFCKVREEEGPGFHLVRPRPVIVPR